MGLTANDYKNELTALLPFGPAWTTDDSSTLSEFLDAWSQEFERIQLRLDNLINEADPRITYELLQDYERLFGLPTACMAGIAQSIDQRHKALLLQMTSTGGQSIAYFIALALAAGFVITITEFTPYNVGMGVDQPILGPAWAYAWRINAPMVTVSNFYVTGGVNETLRSWGNNMLECLINHYKPAHTLPIFAYY